MPGAMEGSVALEDPTPDPGRVRTPALMGTRGSPGDLLLGVLLSVWSRWAAPVAAMRLLWAAMAARAGSTLWCVDGSGGGWRGAVPLQGAARAAAAAAAAEHENDVWYIVNTSSSGFMLARKHLHACTRTYGVSTVVWLGSSSSSGSMSKCVQGCVCPHEDKQLS
jgi:hypothetical protein